ncbi:hypothetical protein [Streptomyces yaizuensis]|nr:hypothetical protein [Streptomyces sp. YSPA8]
MVEGSKTGATGTGATGSTAGSKTRRGKSAGQPRHRVRIPGFARDGGEVGLGDVVTRMTTAVGVRPCGGCGRRADALNRWMAVGGRRAPR